MSLTGALAPWSPFPHSRSHGTAPIEHATVANTPDGLLLILEEKASEQGTLERAVTDLLMVQLTAACNEADARSQPGESAIGARLQLAGWFLRACWV